MFTQAGGASVAGTTEGSTAAAAASTVASSGRMDFGPCIAAWDAVMDDVMQQQPMPPAPASLPAGAEDLLASARASGAAAAVKDVSAGAAAAVLATVSAKAAAAAGRGLMAGSEAAQCPSRTLRAVAAAADRIDRLEGLLADVLERAVRSEGDADEAAERSAAAMQVLGWEGEEKKTARESHALLCSRSSAHAPPAARRCARGHNRCASCCAAAA